MTGLSIGELRDVKLRPSRAERSLQSSNATYMTRPRRNALTAAGMRIFISKTGEPEYRHMFSPVSWLQLDSCGARTRNIMLNLGFRALQRVQAA